MDFVFHPGVNGSDPWVDFYPYTPSLTAGYAFTAIFGIMTLAHIVLMFMFRAWYFIPLLIGGICETFGYYGRARSHPDTTAIGPWAQQQILLLCAPPCIAATIYMVLGRIVTALDAEHHSPIRPKWLTAIFVINDVVTFLTQLAGAGIQVTGDQHIISIGNKAVLAGLVLALVVFCVFVWVAGIFHYRVNREPTGVSRDVSVGGGRGGSGWKRYMWAIYAACGVIVVRNLVKTIQFGAGEGAEVNRKEAYVYVFDAALMFVAVVLLAVWHPGRLIRRARMIKAKRTSGLEMQTPLAAGGWEDRDV